MRYHSPAPLRPFLLAAGMLTVVRVPVERDVAPAELRGSTAFYPLVGLGVGLLPALLLLLPLPPLARALLALAAWVAVTGALHLDGWADCCDAAFAPARADAEATRQRRLAILKDPHVGTFGVAGIVLLLAGKWLGLASAPAAAPLVAAPVARWVMVWALRGFPPARSEGLGAALAGDVPLWRTTGVLMAGVLPLVAAAEDPVRVAAAVVAGTTAGLALAWYLAERFGGVTGDVCGAAGEGAELAALWAFLPWGAA